MFQKYLQKKKVKLEKIFCEVRFIQIPTSIFVIKRFVVKNTASNLYITQRKYPPEFVNRFQTFSIYQIK